MVKKKKLQKETKFLNTWSFTTSFPDGKDCEW